MALNDDLNTPRALAVVWELMKSDIKPGQKRATLLKMDEVLGLGLQRAGKKPDFVKTTTGKQEAIPEVVQSLLDERTRVRAQQDFQRSDELREQIRGLGYDVQDSPSGPSLKKL